MRSLVNWALLGLVIDRPSYAYELAQRFERTYEDALALSSISHVYTALGTLRERELIEEIPGTREGRQPKPHYKATKRGVGEYESWLAGQIDEDRQRQRIFVVQLAALARHPEAAMAILNRYEQACLAEARETTISANADESTEKSGGADGVPVGNDARPLGRAGEKQALDARWKRARRTTGWNARFVCDSVVDARLTACGGQPVR